MPCYNLFEYDIQDYKEAFRYFTLAADQGWVDGQLQLGIMYYCECRFFISSLMQDPFIIIITIYFKNVHFFHAQLGSDVFPYKRLLHISLNTTHSECKPSSSISSFTHSLQVFLPLPAHLTPATTTFLQADTQSSPLFNAPHAHTTSIYHASPPQPCSVPPKDCTNPHCASYPAAAPRTSISPSSVPSSPDFAD